MFHRAIARMRKWTGSSVPAATDSEVLKAQLSKGLTLLNDKPEVRSRSARICAEIERQARTGFVAAHALILLLNAAHADELTQDKRHLDVLEQRLEMHLRWLDSRFPEALPTPEPPAPPRARQIGRIRDLWGAGVETRH